MYFARLLTCTRTPPLSLSVNKSHIHEEKSHIHGEKSHIHGGEKGNFYDEDPSFIFFLIKFSSPWGRVCLTAELVCESLLFVGPNGVSGNEMVLIFLFLPTLDRGVDGYF